MIGAMDNHIAQLLPYKGVRKKWLIFEASVKAARAMTVRLNEWGIRAVCVVGEMDAAERERNIEAFRRGQYDALVNKEICTTGFDVPDIDLLVMRFRTKSLGKYIQVTGRLLRTIGGNIEASIRAGKADGLVFDFGGNIDAHGPLDFLRPKDTAARLVSCEACGKRNQGAAMRCWACDEPMTKMCPACLGAVQKGTLDCGHCGYDMRTGGAGEERAAQKLLETPSGAALISTFAKGSEREGGWLPISKVWIESDQVVAVADFGANATRHDVTGPLAEYAKAAKWLRLDADRNVAALLLPNGRSQSSALQITTDGTQLPVPLPSAIFT
jgi:DNA repair protein RadD